MKKNSRGFSLVEVLLAVAVLTLVVTAMSGVLIYGRQSSAVSGARERALLLVREGQEALRSIKDNDYASLSSLADGLYGLRLQGGVWTLCTCTDSVGPFTRQITLEKISNNIHFAEVSVSWQQTPTRVGNVSAEIEFTNWRRTLSPTTGVFRATEYPINSGFSGSTYSLTLNQNLSQNYFVIVQGSDGNGDNNGTYGPNRNYARLVSDPFQTGDLSASGAQNRLGFSRGSGGGANSWRGVITVVECLRLCNSAGFRLVDVSSTVHSGSNTSGADTANTSWTNLNKVMLMGGFNGSGCETSESSSNDTKVCHARIFPDGSNQIKWTRDSGGASLSTATSTIMAVEWGSEWTIQRRDVSGSNGGNGADETDEYDFKEINPIARDNTWVWGTGHTDDNGIGDSAEGTLITLGDGVNQSITEDRVSIGQEYNDSKSFEVYALTHPSLQVDYRFKQDGNGSDLVYTAPVDVVTSASERMALIYNGQNGTGNAYPRPMFSARYDSNSSIRAERRRSGQDWPAWIQGIDFSRIGAPVAADTTPPAQITNLSASNPTVNNVTLSWTAPGDDGSTGTATSYDVRYSLVPITSTNWAGATQVAGEPAPLASGSSQSMVVSGLLADTQYYFAIRATDEAGNQSTVSNSPAARTLDTMASALRLDVSQGELKSNGRQWEDWELQNTRNTPIVIDQIRISWIGGGTEFDEIELDDDKVYRTRSNNGVVANIDNTTIGSNDTIDDNSIKFRSDMSGTILSLTFFMTDGSSVTFSGIRL